MTDYIKHHGILGMHWGVRRYQNEDGSWTSAGLRRRRENEGSGEQSFLKKHGKTIAKVALATATVAGAAYLYSRNKDAVNSVIKSLGRQAAKTVTEEKSSVDIGKEFVKSSGVSQTHVDRTPVSRTEVSEIHVDHTPVSRIEVSKIHVDRTPVSRTEIPKSKVNNATAARTETPKAQSTKSKINLTFDAKIDPDQDIAGQVDRLKSEIFKQTEAVNNSPDMQKYVEELLRKK